MGPAALPLLLPGFSALHDRFEPETYFAGRVRNSYLNPYAYAPFYALVNDRDCQDPGGGQP